MQFNIQNWISFNFNWINGVYFLLSFILFTIIGTLSHEAGHYAVGKIYFEKPVLHYGFVTYGDQWKAEYEIDKNDTSLETKNVLHQRYLYLILGGPLQTILTGTLGLFLLWSRRKKIFNWKSWIAVFLSYFWAREVYMFVFLGFEQITRGVLPKSGDEVRIAHYLDIHPITIAAILGSIGVLVLSYVTFKKIPLQHRFTFIIAGAIGSIVGFILWLGYLGPVVLP